MDTVNYVLLQERWFKENDFVRKRHVTFCRGFVAA